MVKDKKFRFNCMKTLDLFEPMKKQHARHTKKNLFIQIPNLQHRVVLSCISRKGNHKSASAQMAPSTGQTASKVFVAGSLRSPRRQEKKPKVNVEKNPEKLRK